VVNKGPEQMATSERAVESFRHRCLVTGHVCLSQGSREDWIADDPSWRCISPGERAGVLQNLYVVPGARREGHGSRLIEFVVDTAHAEGLDAVYAHAVPNGGITAAQLKSFYEKNGFEAVGEDDYGPFMRRAVQINK
jgi:GNAT superfamily N-acetyltransferase